MLLTMDIHFVMDIITSFSFTQIKMRNKETIIQRFNASTL